MLSAIHSDLVLLLSLCVNSVMEPVLETKKLLNRDPKDLGAEVSKKAGKVIAHEHIIPRLISIILRSDNR